MLEPGLGPVWDGPSRDGSEDRQGGVSDVPEDRRAAPAGEQRDEPRVTPRPTKGLCPLNAERMATIKSVTVRVHDGEAQARGSGIYGARHRLLGGHFPR